MAAKERNKAYESRCRRCQQAGSDRCTYTASGRRKKEARKKYLGSENFLPTLISGEL